MYTTAVFLYIQRNIVVVLSGPSPRRFMPVYSKPLTLHKGVDNQLQFQFLNQDQKPVDITGLEITFRAIDQTGTTILFQQTLDPVFPATGIMQLNLDLSTLVPVVAQQCFYTLSIPSQSGNANYPVYVDAQAQARGDLTIVNSVLPSIVPSLSVTIPTSQGVPGLYGPYTFNANDQPMWNANSSVWYSSIITNDNNPILTLQMEYYQYTGNIAILGSCTGNGDWAPLQAFSYANVTDTYGYVLEGFYPYVQIAFEANANNIANGFDTLSNIYAR